MTYGELKTLARALLSSDFPLPEDDASIKALLSMAYNYLADKCQVLNLHTKDRTEHIHRLGLENQYVRKAELPESDEDLLDVDEDLGYAAACLIASYISSKKAAAHQARAEDIIRSYNAKVYELIRSDYGR